MFTEIHSYEQFIQLKESEPALLAYFSTDACNVCKVLKPKVGELLHYDFPKIKAVYVKRMLFLMWLRSTRFLLCPPSWFFSMAAKPSGKAATLVSMNFEKRFSGFIRLFFQNKSSSIF